MIETARLTLRRAEPRDVDPLHALYGDAETMRYWSTPPWPTTTATKQHVTRQMKAEPLTYFVWEMDGVAIGNGGEFDKGEIGYILHRNHWGKGLAFEALSALIPYLWHTLNVPCLRANAEPENLASIALLTRLGFVVTGYAHQNFPARGALTNSVYLTLPRPD